MMALRMAVTVFPNSTEPFFRTPFFRVPSEVFRTPLSWEPSAVSWVLLEASVKGRVRVVLSEVADEDEAAVGFRWLPAWHPGGYCVRLDAATGQPLWKTRRVLIRSGRLSFPHCPYFALPLRS